MLHAGVGSFPHRFEAGVGMDHVEPALLRHDASHQLVDLHLGPDVAVDRGGAAAVARDSGHGRAGLGQVHIRDDHLGAGLGGHAGGGRADAGGAARDADHAAREAGLETC